MCTYGPKATSFNDVSIHYQHLRLNPDKDLGIPHPLSYMRISPTLYLKLGSSSCDICLSHAQDSCEFEVSLTRLIQRLVVYTLLIICLTLITLSLDS
jgi:hypothetical protein